MNPKPFKVLHGNLLRPLFIGTGALIRQQGVTLKTSRVLAVLSQNMDEVCFETLHSRYRLLLDPISSEAHYVSLAA